MKCILTFSLISNATIQNIGLVFKTTGHTKTTHHMKKWMLFFCGILLYVPVTFAFWEEIPGRDPALKTFINKEESSTIDWFSVKKLPGGSQFLYTVSFRKPTSARFFSTALARGDFMVTIDLGTLTTVRVAAPLLERFTFLFQTIDSTIPNITFETPSNPPAAFSSSSRVTDSNSQ